MDGIDSSTPEAAQPNQAPPSAPPPMSPQDQMSMQQPTPQAPKSSKGLIIAVIITILVLLGIGGYYYYVNYLKKPVTTTTTPTEVYSPVYTPTSSSTIQSTYDKTTAILPSTDKSKAVDALFQPVLKQVFSSNVKLKDELGPMMTYVVNREITAEDVSAVQSGVNAIGYKTIDSSAKNLTVSKGSYTWVITFSLNDTTKATIDITF